MSQASAMRAVLYALGADSGILMAKGVAAPATVGRWGMVVALRCEVMSMSRKLLGSS
jgi:hypothetical protein